MLIWMSVCVDSDQGVAVAALVEARQSRQLERGPAIAFSDHPRPRRQHRYEIVDEAWPEPGGVAVWGIEEDEIVLTALAPCLSQKGRDALASELPGLPKRDEIAPDGL